MSYFTSEIKDFCTYTYNEQQRDHYKKCEKYIAKKLEQIENLLDDVNHSINNYNYNSYINEKTESEITDLFSEKSNINMDKIESLTKYFEQMLSEAAQRKYDSEKIHEKYVQNVSLEKEREDY